MIFIDLNNVEYGMNAFRSEGMYLDYSHLVEVLSEGYDLMDVKVYDSKPVRGNSELISLHLSLTNAGMDVILKDPAPLENNMDRSCTQKEVDTSLVADVISNAYEDRYDVALIVSGDRDMRPAGDCIKRIGKDTLYRILLLEQINGNHPASYVIPSMAFKHQFHGSFPSVCLPEINA